MNFKGARVTVLGAGLSGRAAASWLRSQGAKVLLSDLRPLENWPEDLAQWCEDLGIGIEAGGHSEKALFEPDLVVASPGINPELPLLAEARERGVLVMGELYLGLSMWQGPVVGITGTNGKTTTTSLVAEMLKKAGVPSVSAGNIGTPVCSLLNEARQWTVAVVEVSSFQLDYFPRERPMEMPRPRFKGVAWLNLSPDHLDRYSDLREYGRSKAKILEFQSQEDWVVFNAQDENLLEWWERARAQRLFFGRERRDIPGAWYVGKGMVEFFGPGGTVEEYSLEKWSLVGEHNLENLCAAIPLARSCGASREGIQQAIDTFRPPAHRLSFVAEVDGVDYYDDSKATNVASVIRAISSIPRPKVLVAGGRGKGEDYSALAEAASRGNVRAVVVIGEEAERLAEAFDKYDVPVAPVRGNGNGFDVMKSAVRKAKGLAYPGDAVLLSPACASFDLFANYQERGRAFCEALAGEDL